MVINTKDLLQKKLDLIQNLIDIKTAHQLFNSDVKDSTFNIIDDNYAKLKCDMSTLKQGSEEYKMVAEFLENTRGYTNIKLLDAFKLNRNDEDKIYNPKKLGNKKLLWHGSRFSNFVGIIS